MGSAYTTSEQNLRVEDVIRKVCPEQFLSSGQALSVVIISEWFQPTVTNNFLYKLMVTITCLASVVFVVITDGSLWLRQHDDRNSGLHQRPLMWRAEAAVVCF